uniref:Uncharacterized protein n=1 Tax=Oryza punctata TaxID=4537 RepID=A0A0E0KDU5_ORYPU
MSAAAATVRSAAAAAATRARKGGGLRWLGTAAEAEREGGAGARWELSAAREYYDYRKSIYGDVTHRALLVDAVGTLVVPAQPTAMVYKSIGEKYGVKYSEDEILARYRRAYEQPWGGSRLRKAGVKTAVVSNFDTRLRPLLHVLKCDHWFDAVAVSAEVAAEKPNPTIFLKACESLGVKPEEAVHVGDDRRNDIWGARDAGCDAWLWGSDVHSFKEVAERIGVEVANLPGILSCDRGRHAAMPGFGAVMFILSRRLQRGSGLRWPSDGQWFSGAIDIYLPGILSCDRGRHVNICVVWRMQLL